MQYLKNLKTSQKISLSFSLFSFLMLVVLLFTINIIYFFIWYNDQKEMSFSDMQTNYLLSTTQESYNLEGFTEFLLTKNTLIIPDEGPLICSPGVAEKVHGDVEKLTNNLFYSVDGTTYFIYSRYFAGVGEVKVFFDTTALVYSQLLIIKISFMIIIVSFFLTLFLGSILSRRLLSPLTSLSKKVQEIDIEGNNPVFNLSGPREDEIIILQSALEKSFTKIQSQTQNLKQFLTDVSHEFKTPLMIIDSKIELFQKKHTHISPEVTDIFSAVKKQTTSMNTLLESLFFLSRIESGVVCLVKEKIDLGQYLGAFFTELSRNYPEKKREIRFFFSENISLEIEKTTFDIILKNLFSNAHKFSFENGYIDIGCDSKSFWIQDYGEGISEENLKHIGEKFFQSERNKSGFGVGLFLVQRIVTVYQWKIQFFSEIGKGTKVQIFFK